MNQNPFEENLKDVLSKYGRDITNEAKEGKIDPVIGQMKKFVILPEYYQEKRKTIQF